MRNILISLILVGLVGGLAGGGLFAHFSDVEEGSALFIADNVDLAVDADWYDGGAEQNPWPESVPLINPAETADIKPGMCGESTISLHVYCTEADLWLMLDNLTSGENGILDPEAEAGDPSADDGELVNYLWLQLWEDNGVDGEANTTDFGEGDNEKQPEEAVIWEGYAAELMALAAAEEPYDCVLLAGPILLTHCNVYYMGVKWCFIQDVAGQPHCNISMGDTFGTDIAFFTKDVGSPPPTCPPPP
jgi:hypothetical protein